MEKKLSSSWHGKFDASWLEMWLLVIF
jgi:hypothetical protein